MKTLIAVLSFFVATFTVAQTHYNLDKGTIAEGYDVVAYFNNKAVEGKKSFKTTFDGAVFLFSSQNNLDTFKANPDKYTPQYGGWCAYAIGEKSKKVSIDPETFEIRDGKLYLFYNSWGTNTLELWSEQPEELKSKADANWKQILKN